MAGALHDGLGAVELELLRLEDVAVFERVEQVQKVRHNAQQSVLFARQEIATLLGPLGAHRHHFDEHVVGRTLACVERVAQRRRNRALIGKKQVQLVIFVAFILLLRTTTLTLKYY